MMTTYLTCSENVMSATCGRESDISLKCVRVANACCLTSVRFELKLTSNTRATSSK